VGTTVEFKMPGTFPPVTDMTGGGPFKLKPGEWTDDTSMALCLAASLTETKRFDRLSQLTRYSNWFHKGYMSSNGRCFDIGGTVRTALAKFSNSGKKLETCGDPSRKKGGNGSLMRLCPVPMAYAQLPEEKIEVAIINSGKSSETTHPAPQCIDCCRYYGGLIIGALLGKTKEEILSPYYCPIKDYWKTNKLDEEVIPIAEGTYKDKNPPDIAGTGYSVKTMEAALWAFHTTTNFKDGCLKVVNLGLDADTTGAVYGQLAGAYYGMSGIPTGWLKKLAKKEFIEKYAQDLFELAKNQQLTT
jgi:ADP-ribosyl-[dinitrogen reductase] hydrolase